MYNTKLVLDKGFLNETGMFQFSRVVVRHLVNSILDHLYISLDFEGDLGMFGNDDNKRFHFEVVWPRKKTMKRLMLKFETIKSLERAYESSGKVLF